MEFTEILNPKTIVTHLKADNKAEALEALADLFVRTGTVKDKETYLKDVYVRERIGETGIGNHIAIPHGRSESVVRPGAAIAVLDHEIEWESLDDTGAKVVILFAVGTDNAAAEDHLRLLAMFSKRLGNDAVVSKLMDADAVEDVMHILTEESGEEETETNEEELDPDEILIL